MGGAKNCPETPRQKMIGMMYLVLTAMLALNVSTDILNGFKLVDDSLHSTIDATEVRNSNMYNEFEYLYQQNPVKMQDEWEHAIVLRRKTDSLYNYVQNFKYQIAILADGPKKADPEARNIDGNSNLDITGTYALVTIDPKTKKTNGETLRMYIEGYKDYLISLVNFDSVMIGSLNTVFATPMGKDHDGNPISWAESVFDGMPVGASVTILTKLQNDIRTAEGEIIQHLKGKSDASDFRVNSLEALVIPVSSYVMRGGRYKAQIVLSAVDSTKKPIYYVGSTQLGEDGIYEVGCGSTGTFKYSGELRLPKHDGTSISLPFSSEYSVGEPSVTISNTDLNIMYRDYENPFAISVPGISSDHVQVTVTGATKTQRGDKYMIKPNGNAKEVVIAVQAQLDGKMQSMGQQTYRVKELPKPGAYFKSGSVELFEGNISRNVLLNSDASIIASYGPDGLLDLKFTISSFSIRTANGIWNTKGNKFSQEQINQLSKLKKGAIVNITDVRAKGPTGKETTLRGISLVLN
ncbi:MAG: gliding motility protein GldM [Paludibacter sp.]|nr:gliding motility protein GldM [Bacteroidales bacterium]MCM1069574.1 gliding motility protein GldM [Prevotella sp.]MCM1354220.1 gliding motility protein GldM [Bacteroides sp.]MCM1443041.1 gliding motility protein GldM [Muribaculum sp.]MCM1482294.1 gliding motility protein GldM [Paludibacter sp.]